MNLTVKFSGHVADVIEELVGRGIAATKAEALRLGILKLEQEYLRGNERAFDEWAAGEAMRQDKLISEGKLKLYSQKEFERKFGKAKAK